MLRGTPNLKAGRHALPSSSWTYAFLMRVAAGLRALGLLARSLGEGLPPLASCLGWAAESSCLHRESLRNFQPQQLTLLRWLFLLAIRCCTFARDVATFSCYCTQQQ